MVKRSVLLLLLLAISYVAFSTYRLQAMVSHDVVSRPLPQAESVASAAAFGLITAAAFRAVSKLIATCSIGIVAERTGLLDKTALSVLSKLIFGLFQPCLLFTNVANTVLKLGGTGGPVTLLPLAAAIQIALSFCVGKIVSLAIYGPHRQSSDGAKQLLACTTFGNAGPLPFVFVDTILKHHSDTSHLSKGMAFVSLYLLGWSPIFWTVAPAMLSQEDDRVCSSIRSKWKDLGKRVLSPPVLGSMLGMLVGMSPLSKLLMLRSSPLYPLFAACSTLGEAYLPAVLLVLAGSLAPTNETAKGEDTSSNSAVVNTKDSSELAKQVVTIYIARFVLLPILGFSVLTEVKRHIPSLDSLLSDPVLLFVLLLETCMPSAQNTTVILQLQGNRSGASQIARTLMIIYVLGIPAIAFWLVKILALTDLAS